MDYVNEFVINGKIVSIKDGKYPAIRVVTKNGKMDSYPLINCTQKMIDKLKLRVQSHVKVEGYLQSIYVKTQNGFQKKQVFRAKSISAAETLCESKFGSKSSGKFFETPSAVVYIKGVFENQKIRDDGWASLIVRISDKESDTLKINIKSNPKSKQLQKGDIVCIVAGISTVNKKFGEENRHFENIIVNDLSVEKTAE